MNNKNHILSVFLSDFALEMKKSVKKLLRKKIEKLNQTKQDGQMDTAKILQIPSSMDECKYLMRSYIHIDKFNGTVHIQDISPFFAPGFILGICAHIPFLQEFVEPYIIDVGYGNIHEVCISDEYSRDIELNAYVNANAETYSYTPTDCDFVLSVLLNAITFSMYGHEYRDFENHVDESVTNISTMANIYPMAFYFPQSFRDTMKTTLISTPNLRIRMMSLLCQNDFNQQESVWALVKVRMDLIKITE